MRYIVKHQGFNRQQRRHNPDIKSIIKDNDKAGHPVPRNIPYKKRG